ncbi:MAG: twin-arginine translocase subunit TatC [Flavobacteriales bacterium]|nr:twin-arginine translocase subunit TatC [Flavobacteriales bacterium]
MAAEHKHPDEMSFLDHLEVLRWHLVRSSIAVFILAAIAFVNRPLIFDTILFGPKSGSFPTYVVLCKMAQQLGLDESLCMTDLPFQIINIDMSGQFTLHIMVSIISGLVMAFPYILWEIWRFIRPALHQKERRYARGLVFYTSFLFISGLLFGYFVISPLSVQFLGTYQVSAQVPNQPTLNSFIMTEVLITVASGLIFEMPVLVYFLTKMGLISPEFLKKYRRHAIVINLVLAAIITPPDISSQILMAIPLLILYQISIWISGRVLKKEAANQD